MITSRSARRRGFTLIELLVVIGIIALLAALLLPAIFRVQKNAAIARAKDDLNTISIALEEYKKVFHDYPRQGDPNMGSGTTSRDRLLVQYLIGPGGEGVRVAGTSGTNTQGGKKWGPYLPPDKFRYGIRYAADGTTELSDRLLDRNGQEIMYYPRYNNYDNRQGLPTPTSATGEGYLLGKVSASALSNSPPTIRAMYNLYDGLMGQHTDKVPPAVKSAAVTEHILQTLYMLGDGADSDLAGNPPDNQITATAPKNEVLNFKGDYILCSAGPDRKWGRDTTDGITYTYKKRSDSDDVYQFGR